MNGNTELLNFICKDTEIGANALAQMLEIVDSIELKKQLELQLAEYKEIGRRAEELLAQRGGESAGVGLLDELKASLTISAQTLADRSAPHVAGLLIAGGNAREAEAARMRRSYSHADEPILRLTDRLCAFEQHSTEQNKAFL